MGALRGVVTRGMAREEFPSRAGSRTTKAASLLVERLEMRARALPPTRRKRSRQCVMIVHSRGCEEVAVTCFRGTLLPAQEGQPDLHAVAVRLRERLAVVVRLDQAHLWQDLRGHPHHLDGLVEGFYVS